MRYLIYLFLVFVFYSCSYKTITKTTWNGDKIKYRKYKDSVKEKKYGKDERSRTIYNFKPKQYSKYSGTLSYDSSDGYVYFQYNDTSRIYLRLGNIMWESDPKYLSLFTNGLLYPKLIQCALDSLCRPIRDYKDTEVTVKNSIKGTLIGNEPKYFLEKDSLMAKDTIYIYSVPCHFRFGWPGNLIEFYRPKEFPSLEKSKKIKVIDFSVHQYNRAPCEHYFRLYLKNEKAYKGEDFSSFCKDAKVIVIKYMYTMFEI